jgi:hypothetical protein
MLQSTSVYRRTKQVIVEHLRNGFTVNRSFFYQEEEINNGDFIRECTKGYLFGLGGDLGELEGPDVGVRSEETSKNVFGLSKEHLFGSPRGRGCGRIPSIFGRHARYSPTKAASGRLYGRRIHSADETDRVLESAIGACRKREVVRSVVPFSNLEQLHKILERLSISSRNRGGPGFKLFGVHWENQECSCGHLHIYHDCNPNHGACRCTFLQGIPQPVLHAKGCVSTADFDKWDLTRVLLYPCTGRRQPTHLFIDDRRAAIPTQAALLQNSRLRGYTGTRPMEESLRGHNDAFSCDESSASTSGAAVRDCGIRGPRSRWIGLGKESVSYESRMYIFILHNYVVPIGSIVRTRRWLESTFRFVRTSEKTFQTVIDTVNAEWIRLTLPLIHSKWLYMPYRFWEDPEWCEINGMRYSLDESVSLAERVLIYQFGSEDGVKDFLQCMYDVLSRRHNKKNALEIESPPSAGKNYMIDPLLLFMGSVGQVANMSRSNQFGFDNCFNKRVCLMNEPRFENASREQLLMFLAGDVFSAQGKYKSVSDIVRTPVIILTNSSPFPNTPQWNDRIYRFKWRRCEWLKEHKSKLNPLYFINLCNKYNVQ